MEKIALHIIAKDENKELKRIINDYEKYFDEIVIAYDSVSAIDEIVVTPKIKLYKYDWDEVELKRGFPDFAKKRNFVVSKTESRYYFRLDTDDIIVNPSLIRGIVDKMQSTNVNCVMCDYIYSRDTDGNCTSRHWRETIIEKTDKMYWNKTIHENIFAPDENDYRAIRDNSIVIVHNIDEEHLTKSAERNFAILIEEFQKDKENTDPRTLAYIGRMLIGFGNYEKAIPFLKLLVTKSGWDDDKYFGYIDIARCYTALKNYDLAIAACNESLSLNTEFPDAYLYLCEIYINKKDYQKAVSWGSIGVTKKQPDTQFVTDPSTYNIRAIINLAIAYFGAGNYEKAHALFLEASRRSPSNEFLKNNKKMFEDALENSDFIKCFSNVYSKIRKEEPDKISSLVDIIPKSVLQDERMQSFYMMASPTKKWDSNSIVIYCGKSTEDWGPASVVSGVGGSEEAVIYLSKELSKLGYKVTVFNCCGIHEGQYGDVEYLEHYKFQPKDDFNIVISWRNDLFESFPDLKAKKKVVWLHDVPTKEFTGRNADTIVVLSNYHASLLSDKVDNSKVFVSSNGINLKDFNVETDRNKNRIIYTSSYDRGIEHLLRVWSDVKKEVPDAELHLFYGWNTYDAFTEMGFRDGSFKYEMIPLMNQPGVFEHGRVGHKQLVKELAKSKFWVYPCNFEEISCISAMKAQAAGCVPVCTNYAALAETVKDGVIINGKAGEGTVNANFKNKLIEALKTQPVVSIDKEQFGWNKVAEYWHNELFSGVK